MSSDDEDDIFSNQDSTDPRFIISDASIKNLFEWLIQCANQKSSLGEDVIEKFLITLSAIADLISTIDRTVGDVISITKFNFKSVRNVFLVQNKFNEMKVYWADTVMGHDTIFQYIAMIMLTADVDVRRSREWFDNVRIIRNFLVRPAPFQFHDTDTPETFVLERLKGNRDALFRANMSSYDKLFVVNDSGRSLWTLQSSVNSEIDAMKEYLIHYRPTPNTEQHFLELLKDKSSAAYSFLNKFSSDISEPLQNKQILEYVIDQFRTWSTIHVNDMPPSETSTEPDQYDFNLEDDPMICTGFAFFASCIRCFLDYVDLAKDVDGQIQTRSSRFNTLYDDLCKEIKQENEKAISVMYADPNFNFEKTDAFSTWNASKTRLLSTIAGLQTALDQLETLPDPAKASMTVAIQTLQGQISTERKELEALELQEQEIKERALASYKASLSTEFPQPLVSVSNHYLKLSKKSMRDMLHANYIPKVQKKIESDNSHIVAKYLSYNPTDFFQGEVIEYSIDSNSDVLPTTFYFSMDKTSDDEYKISCGIHFWQMNFSMGYPDTGEIHSMDLNFNFRDTLSPDTLSWDTVQQLFSQIQTFTITTVPLSDSETWRPFICVAFASSDNRSLISFFFKPIFSILHPLSNVSALNSWSANLSAFFQSVVYNPWLNKLQTTYFSEVAFDSKDFRVHAKQLLRYMFFLDLNKSLNALQNSVFTKNGFNYTITANNTPLCILYVIRKQGWKLFKASDLYAIPVPLKNSTALETFLGYSLPETLNSISSGKPLATAKSVPKRKASKSNPTPAPASDTTSNSDTKPIKKRAIRGSTPKTKSVPHASPPEHSNQKEADSDSLPDEDLAMLQSDNES